MRNTLSSSDLTQYRNTSPHRKKTLAHKFLYDPLHKLLNFLFDISRVDFVFIKILSFGKARAGSKSKSHNLRMILEA